jgi:hypothetical protein
MQEDRRYIKNHSPVVGLSTYSAAPGFCRGIEYSVGDNIVVQRQDGSAAKRTQSYICGCDGNQSYDFIVLMKFNSESFTESM